MRPNTPVHKGADHKKDAATLAMEDRKRRAIILL
jgi:hypothetical protein